MASLKWYTVQTKTGCEKRVVETLENIKKREHLEKEIGRIIIPTEEVAEIKDSKKRVVTRKIMPGYILVELELNDRTWNLIKETPNVSGFVGPKKTPVPLRDDEVQNILGMMSQSSESPRQKISFEMGDRVKVIDGPFLNFAGNVSHINAERGRVTVMIEVLGRATPVELDFLQVEKTAAT